MMVEIVVVFLKYEIFINRTKSIHSDTLETLTWSTMLNVASFFLTLTVCLILIIASDAKNVQVTIVEKPQIKKSFCKITWISYSYLIRQALKGTVVIRTYHYKWRVTWHSFYSFFKESLFIFDLLKMQLIKIWMSPKRGGEKIWRPISKLELLYSAHNLLFYCGHFGWNYLIHESWRKPI